MKKGLRDCALVLDSERPRTAGTDRVQLPSLEFHGPDGSIHGVYGYASYEDLRAAASSAGVVVPAAGYLARRVRASLRTTTAASAIR